MPNKLGRTPEKEHKIDAAQIIFSIAAALFACFELPGFI
jgi:hypothetical protein